MNPFLVGTFCVITILMGIVLHAAENGTLDTKKTIVILLGPPGSGKGTQAASLTKALNIPHISTGDLFRENLSKNTELGQKVKSYMNEGKLVPDELVLDMLFDRISKPDAANGYLLDGFPRTIPQAEAFEKHLNQNDHISILNLQVSDDLIVKRTAGRLTCKKCNQMYNINFSPPSKEGICDKCGGELCQRADDAPAVVQERLRVYHEQTEPLVEYYGKKGMLININGEEPQQVVFQNLMKAIRKQ